MSAEPISWPDFAQTGHLSEEQLRLILHYDSTSPEQQPNLLDSQGETFYELFVHILKTIPNERVVIHILSHILKHIAGDYHRAAALSTLEHQNPSLEVYSLFLGLLNRTHPDVRSLSFQIFAFFFRVDAVPDTASGPYLAALYDALYRSADGALSPSPSPTPPRGAGDLIAEKADAASVVLSSPTLAAPRSSPVISSDDAATGAVLAALQTALREDAMRLRIHGEKGLSLLLPVLRAKHHSIQLIYQTLFCLWMLSFNAEIAPRMHDTISPLVHILKTQSKEKVVRMALQILANLSGNAEATDAMIEAGLLPQLDNMLVVRWKDEDLVECLEALTETLNASVSRLCSAEAYTREVESGTLDWTPVHKSDRFWRENCAKFEADNFHLLRSLAALLYTSHARTLAVACHDLGNFARFHPRGKAIVEELGVKAQVLGLMSHSDADVQKEALLCVQKLLVQRWDTMSSMMLRGRADPAAPH